MEGVDKGLEAREVPDQLEDSHDPHDSDQSDDLTGLTNDLEREAEII